MEITGETDLFYIVGTPVRHFRAPILFNDYFASCGHNFCCAGLNVQPADLADALSLVRRIENIRGLCITAPHKIAAASMVDRHIREATQAGSVNFVRRETDGTLTGHNLDGLGFLRGLKGSGFDPVGKRVLLLGAGGVGRAIAFSLAAEGVTRLLLANRDTAKAHTLAAEVARATGIKAMATGTGALPDLSDFDLIVNATSVGMGGGGDMPMDLTGVSASATVADVVIGAQDTPLIAAAKRAGCSTMVGSSMLKPQIELSETFLYGTAKG